MQTKTSNKPQTNNISHINPGNEGFVTIRNGIYVDKTGLIDVINKTINTADKLTCISRPRRFGKTYTAKMLCAYYDKTCDSEKLFSDLVISKTDLYKNYLNALNVVYIDITGYISAAKKVSDVVKNIRQSLTEELISTFPALQELNGKSIGDVFLAATKINSEKFFFVIDEWDALFREQKDNLSLQEEYINFLRELFKNGPVTDNVVAGAFMTGILPIKKYGHQSAISDFREYTMVAPSLFAEYVGFTKKDIDSLAQNYKVNKTKLKTWYDGYSFPKVGSIYNPNSVCQAIRTQEYSSYWAKTETYAALLEYINLDTNGLQGDIIQMIGGNSVPVDTSTFQNDMTSSQSRDDVLSLLIHLGYIAYDSKSKTAKIPNEEIREEFISTVRNGSHDATNRIISNSDQLIEDTINGDENAVARAIEEAHSAGTFGIPPLFYNNEQALRSVVKFAYISCANTYIKIEELPSGNGYADIVYIPKPGTNRPVLLIELKANDTANAAIAQIHANKYPKIFEGITGDIILCGISYDRKTKHHICKIEKMTKHS